MPAGLTDRPLDTCEVPIPVIPVIISILAFVPVQTISLRAFSRPKNGESHVNVELTPLGRHRVRNRGVEACRTHSAYDGSTYRVWSLLELIQYAPRALGGLFFHQLSVQLGLLLQKILVEGISWRLRKR